MYVSSVYLTSQDLVKIRFFFYFMHIYMPLTVSRSKVSTSHVQVSSFLPVCTSFHSVLYIYHRINAYSSIFI